MTCLLCVKQGVDDFFAVVKGVGDVLAGRVEELFAVVKGVGDVLAGLDVELGVVFLWCQGRR